MSCSTVTTPIAIITCIRCRPRVAPPVRVLIAGFSRAYSLRHAPVTRQASSLAVLLVLVAASVFAGTLLLLRDAYGGGLSNALGADGNLQPGEYHAVVLLQPTDCGTRLEVLHALAPARKA